MSNFTKNELENMSIETFRGQLEADKTFRDFIIFYMNTKSLKECTQIIQGILFHLRIPQEKEVFLKVSDWFIEVLNTDRETILSGNAGMAFDLIHLHIKLHYPEFASDDFVINSFTGISASLAKAGIEDKQYRQAIGINQKGLFTKVYY